MRDDVVWARKRRRTLSALIGLVSLLLLSADGSGAQGNPSGSGPSSSNTFFGQAAAARLDRNFPSPRVEYLLLDFQSREILAERWPHDEMPIAPGSLLKPFIALAYAQTRERNAPLQSQPPAAPVSFPHIVCHGKADGCWRAGGHGLVGLEQALAVSCNAYFFVLARETTAHRDALRHVSATYGLPAPPPNPTASMLIGVTPEWRIPPLTLARAYASLIGSSGMQQDMDLVGIDRQVTARLREGMREAASSGGTAAKAGGHTGGVLAKTGTASCVREPVASPARSGNDTQEQSRCRVNGDGLVILAAPAEHPRWLLLVRERGTTGAVTAEIAGKMLTSLEEQEAQRR